MKVALPILETLAALSGESSDVSNHLQHNVQVRRWINGAFGMLKDETLAFYTQQDYWYRTDRRIVEAYPHRRLRESCFPAADLRALAQHLFRHFEGKVAARGLGAAGLVREAEWPEYRGLYTSAIRDLPNPPEYGRLKARWKRLTGATLAEDVLQFLRDIEGLAAPNQFEPDFFYRMQWLPYVGQAAYGGGAARWQRLFFAFYTLFASTNAFAQGGGLSFAPILQSDPLRFLLGHARNWANGERPDRVGFRVETKWEEKDCSHSVPVAELYGLLNLDLHPFCNNVNAATYVAFAIDADGPPYDRLEGVGAWMAPSLAEHFEAEPWIDASFASLDSATLSFAPVHGACRLNVHKPLDSPQERGCDFKTPAALRRAIHRLRSRSARRLPRGVGATPRSDTELRRRGWSTSRGRWCRRKGTVNNPVVLSLRSAFPFRKTDARWRRAGVTT